MKNSPNTSCVPSDDEDEEGEGPIPLWQPFILACTALPIIGPQISNHTPPYPASIIDAQIIVTEVRLYFLTARTNP